MAGQTLEEIIKRNVGYKLATIHGNGYTVADVNHEINSLTNLHVIKLISAALPEYLRQREGS